MEQASSELNLKRKQPEFRLITGEPFFQSITAKEAPNENAKIDTLPVLTQVTVKKEGKIEDKTPQIQKNFNFLMRTRDIEYKDESNALYKKNPHRIDSLQAIVDQMTEGKIKTRVAIMNKGEESEAFVYPDGTIFLSQSLINRLDSLDEVTTILAHEVSHLLLKSFERKEHEEGVGNFGIHWLHELASDTYPIELMQKVGANTLAFSTAIQKISPANARGVVHQSSIARGSQVVGAHNVIDSSTSNKQLTPLSLEFIRPVAKSNLNLINEAITQKDEKAFGILLEKLHPHDLKVIFERIMKAGDYYSMKKPYKLLEHEFYAFQRTTLGLITKRIEEKGFSHMDSLIFLILKEEELMQFISKTPPIIHDIPTLKTILTQACKEDYGRKKEKIEETLFEVTNRPVNGLASIINYVSRKIYDEYDIDNKSKLTLSREDFFDILRILSPEIPEADSISFNFLTYAYLNATFLETARDDELDEDQIRDFFQEMKNEGIQISGAFLYNRPPEKSTEQMIANWNKAAAIAKEIFSQPEDDFSKERIDAYFSFFEENNFQIIDTFFFAMKQHFQKETTTNEEKTEYLAYLNEKINTFVPASQVDLLLHLDTNENIQQRELSDEVKNSNQKIAQYNLKVLAAISLFETDSHEFYAFVTKAMEDTHIDVTTLSRVQLYNLTHPIINIKNNSFSHSIEYFLGGPFPQIIYPEITVKTENFDELLSLPFIKELYQRDIPFHSTLRSLNVYYSDEMRRMYPASSPSTPYSDNLGDILFFKPLRDNLEHLLSQGIHESDYPYLLDSVNKFYPHSVTKERFISEINKRYLASNASLPDKIEFLSTNFDSLGFEGMRNVAEQITDMTTYALFRDKMKEKLDEYLSGKGRVSALGLADLTSAQFMNETSVYTMLASTQTDKKSLEKNSTSFASTWVSFYMHPYTQGAYQYDPISGKFDVSLAGRTTFQSLHDVFERLRALSPTQRFATALKILTEQYGILEIKNSREHLGKTLCDALNIKDRFISQTLTLGLAEAEPTIISFPIASMLGPLLFRSLDENAINTFTVSQERNKWNDKTNTLEKIEEDEKIFDRIFKLPTRDLIVFGAQFKKDPASQIAILANESDEQYHALTNRLNDFLKNGNGYYQNGEQAHSKYEAVISGVEKSGSLGARSLQLAAQFIKSDEKTEERLSHSFDKNPGIDKLFIWENLYRMAKSDPTIAAFVNSQLISIDQHLGAGSLFTTRAIHAKNTDGMPVAAILKILNPNAEAFLEKSNLQAKNALEQVKRKNRGKVGNQARLAEQMIALSYEWCKEDINDPHFEDDDDRFASVIALFNEIQKSDTFYKPERILTTKKLKVETLAPGKTVNTMLRDAAFPKEEKVKVIEKLAQFMAFQLAHNGFIDENGKEFVLIHSDPHVGNYVLDYNGTEMKLGVIDRSMYLRIDKKDIEPFKSLFIEQNTQKFFDQFVKRVIDSNGITNSFEKTRIMALIKSKAFIELRKSGNDYAQLMQHVIADIASLSAQTNDGKKDLHIPLAMRLMIRNIGALEALCSDYNVSIQEAIKK